MFARLLKEFIEAILDRLEKPVKAGRYPSLSSFSTNYGAFWKGRSAKLSKSKTGFLTPATEQLMEHALRLLSLSRGPTRYWATFGLFSVYSPLGKPLFNFTGWSSGSFRARDVFECVWLEQIGSRKVEMKPRSWKKDFYGQSFIQLAGRRWKQDNIWRSYGVTQTTWRTTSWSDAWWTKQRNQVWRLG